MTCSLYSTTQFQASLELDRVIKIKTFTPLPGLAATETDILAQLEEPRQPRINVSQDFQADLPEICTNRIDLHRAPEDMLWDPGINDRLEDSEGQNLTIPLKLYIHLDLLTFK